MSSREYVEQKAAQALPFAAAPEPVAPFDELISILFDPESVAGTEIRKEAFL